MNPTTCFFLHHSRFGALDFLVRYYGPLQVDPKKIHVSLVGCLRNHRGIQKKQQQKLTTVNIQDDEDNEHSLDLMNEFFPDDC